MAVTCITLCCYQVVVHVDNQLVYETTTIHWHGIHMKNTPWMDGVAYVTQCPILPRQKFTYRFKAEPHGTHWYHAQVDHQRLDGLYGMLVIHPTVPSTPEFLVTVTDWLHFDAVRYERQNPFRAVKPGSGEMTNNFPPFADFMADNSFVNVVKYYGALINGRGRWQDRPFPLSEFRVKRGQNNRFRLANVGLENSFEIFVDGHQMDVVAVDGNEIVPVREVDFILIHTGETVDFEINADQPSARYWIRAVIRRVGVGPYPTPDGLTKGVYAMLHYDDSHSTGDPTTNEKLCSAVAQCSVFNCLYKDHPTDKNKICTGMQEARSQLNPLQLDIDFGLGDPDSEVVEYFFNFAFPAYLVSVNAKRYVDSRAPLYVDDKDRYITECNEDKCQEEGCRCTNIQPIPFNKTIQIVIMSYMIDSPANTHHTVHLHGHSFAVLKVGYADLNATSGFHTVPNQDIQCTSTKEALCSTSRWRNQRPELNKENPPIKNTVGVPSNGYVVVRFRSTNPGFWFFRCHMEQHFMDGMFMVLNEAPGRHPPPPEGFSTCKDFDWTDDEYHDYIKRAEMTRTGGAPDDHNNDKSESSGENSGDENNKSGEDTSGKICI